MPRAAVPPAAVPVRTGELPGSGVLAFAAAPGASPATHHPRGAAPLRPSRPGRSQRVVGRSRFQWRRRTADGQKTSSSLGSALEEQLQHRFPIRSLDSQVSPKRSPAEVQPSTTTRSQLPPAVWQLWCYLTPAASKGLLEPYGFFAASVSLTAVIVVPQDG